MKDITNSCYSRPVNHRILLSLIHPDLCCLHQIGNHPLSDILRNPFHHHIRFYMRHLISDDNDLRIKNVDRVHDPDRQIITAFKKDLNRIGVLLSYQPSGILKGKFFLRHVFLIHPSGKGDRRTVILQTSIIAAHTSWPMTVNGHMTDFPRRADVSPK